MNKKISNNDERKLTLSIEKAATLAVADSTKDRNKLLADCLLAGDVPPRFAKLASAAFNRRVTVLTFQSRDENSRADDFPLTDADAVISLVGGNGMAKAASSAHQPAPEFSIRMETMPAMRKAAAFVQPAKPLYENRISADGMERHLESVMQAQASAHSHMIGAMDKLAGRIQQQQADVARMLERCDSFTFQTMCNLHGSKLGFAMMDVMPGHEFKKQASAIDPGTTLSRKVASLISDLDDYIDINNALVDYQDGLGEFSKSAAAYATNMRKQATVTSAVLGNAVRGGLAVSLTGAQAMDKVRRSAGESYLNAAENAKSLYRAGEDKDMSPGKALDSEFLVKDRYYDRLMGWSDMSAEPSFSMYPAEQVFMATQKAMNVSPALERPDNREILRAQVGQMLSQGGRLSTADTAAMATTLRGLSQSQPSAAESAALSVSALDKVTTPEAPEWKAILPDKPPVYKDYVEQALRENKLDSEAAEKMLQTRAAAEQKAAEEGAREAKIIEEKLERKKLEDKRESDRWLLEEARLGQRMDEQARQDQRERERVQAQDQRERERVRAQDQRERERVQAQERKEVLDRAARVVEAERRAEVEKNRIAQQVAADELRRAEIRMRAADRLGYRLIETDTGDVYFIDNDMNRFTPEDFDNKIGLYVRNRA